MFSDTIMVILCLCVVVIFAFIIRTVRNGKPHLIHKIYLTASVLLAIWMLSLIAMKLTDPANTIMLYVWDALVYLGCGTISTLCLLTVLVFTKGLERMPKSYYWLFVVPVIVNLAVWTNPLHHLFYRVFSVDINQVVFGPILYLSGLYIFIQFGFSIFYLVRFAVKSQNRLFMKQAALFAIGSLVPAVVNLLTTLRIFHLTIAATPISLIVTMACHGLAIFHFHFLDIKPLAMQRVLDWISDCYLITTESGLILGFNQPLLAVFGACKSLRENGFLSDCLKDEDLQNCSAMYNLISSIEASRTAKSNVSYEQPVQVIQNDELTRLAYMAEVTPLIIEERIQGFVVIFKDITKIKESMQRLQDSHIRMREQERLASLGQMAGGLAHNLKTPIMSISGSATAMENLVVECEASLGDSEVTPSDYREIYAEMRDWLDKTREACAYMSDIISAVKGQAANVTVSESAEFSLDDLLRRVSLLLRHELLSGGCKLQIEDHMEGEVFLHGDINNLVQVVNNLISNAIDAQLPGGDHTISIGIARNAEAQALDLTVRDRGVGVPPEIAGKLFRQMVTSKGTRGTGLGIYISNAVIRGKFDGTMWYQANPPGGSIFGMSFPIGNITIKERKQLRN